MNKTRITIRKANKEDARKIFTLIRKNLVEVNSRDYPKKIIHDLCGSYSPSWIKEIIENSYAIVVIQKGKLIGFGRFKDGRIYDIYINPSCHGKGVGRKIMNKLESYAKKNNYKKISLPASKTAIEFYKKLGYKFSKRKIKESFEMEKKLK